MDRKKLKFIAKLERSNYLHNVLMKLTHYLRIRLIEENFKWKTINTLQLSYGLYTFVAYIYNLQKFRDDFDFVCYSTIVNAPIVSGIYRLYNWPYKYDQVYRLYTIFHSLDRKYPLHSRQNKIVKKYNVFINFINVSMLILIGIMGVLLMVYPFILYFLFHMPLELPVPMLLIEIDATTTRGYILNYLYQFVGTMLFLCGMSIVQPLNIMYVGLVTCMTEILRSKVKEFEQIILIDDDEATHNKDRLKKAFAKLIDDHNEILEIAGEVEEVLSFQLFLDITVFSISVCIGLFYARVRDWYPGYVMAAIVVLVGFLNHFLGELSTIQMEHLLYDIYNVSWYRMNVSMQKSWRFFLQRPQETQLFTCAGLKPVGIDTFSSFVNSIYSYFLLLNDLIQTFAV